jgi:hypothetical protein
MESDLAENETKFEAARMKGEEIDKQLQPIRERLEDISLRYNQIIEVQTRIGTFIQIQRVVMFQHIIFDVPGKKGRMVALRPHTSKHIRGG